MLAQSGVAQSGVAQSGVAQSGVAQSGVVQSVDRVLTCQKPRTRAAPRQRSRFLFGNVTFAFTNHRRAVLPDGGARMEVMFVTGTPDAVGPLLNAKDVVGLVVTVGFAFLVSVFVAAGGSHKN